MRDFSEPLRDVVADLSSYARKPLKRAQLEAMCQVEIGLHLQETLMRGAAAAEAWVLFSGYPFARARGIVLDAGREKMLSVARYTMWTLRRRRAWRDALETYQKIERPLRGYELGALEEPAMRCGISVANYRWDVYQGLFHRAPPLIGNALTPARPGPHAFLVGRNIATVDLPELSVAPPVGHDLEALPAGRGAPLTFVWADLLATAAKMDARSPKDWVGRLSKVTLSTNGEKGFSPADKFTVDGLQHLLGIVGAGKSTLRDVLAVHMVNECKRRVTIVVGDVAEVLKLVELYNMHTSEAAAPVIGAAGQQKHAQRLHRRLDGRGEHRILAHDDPGFAYLSTSCVVNALRSQVVEDDVLGYGEAPCSRLLSRSRRNPSPASGHHGVPKWQKKRLACPYWSACPRHHASRALVDAGIWVATPASLVDTSTAWPQNDKRMRYLELACRRSDLVIVDEADRVQTQFDRMFAPDVPLIGKGGDSAFLDEVNEHTIRQLIAGGRTQLSDRDVENWSAALSTATAATNRLYAMLVGDHSLRKWVRIGYFSAWTLQKGLLDECYPLAEGEGGGDSHCAPRETLSKQLDAFRDNPFGDRMNHGESIPKLTSILTELLHTNSPERTRGRLDRVLSELFGLTEVMLRKRAEHRKACEERRREDELRAAEGKKPKRRRALQDPEGWREGLVRRFEFTLMLCALEPRLALINAMWPRVEASLNLGFNSMYRRPVDYGPVVPEAPMGNVIGFQFLVEGPDEGGVRSGELMFFRYSGVGRELLREMPSLPTVDGRPGTNVLLMSGSSWAGLSNRYHVSVPVGVLIEPPPREMKTIVDDTHMRIEFVHEDREALTASGAGLDIRPDVLCRMAASLGASVGEADTGGPLELELRSLPEKRKHLLLLVGSYDEARIVADTLHNLNPRWKNRVLRLVADDDDIEADDAFAGDEYRARVLRRGDIESLKECDADILVAPLLAVERGHNILDDGVAAIGTVYFLIRPHPRPDDMSLAVHSMNDWIVRSTQSGGEFEEWARTGTTLEHGAQEVRKQARNQWYRLLSRTMAWSRLGDGDRDQVTWDLLVLMWQVIGRLLRGSVPARVVFVDAAFMPHQAARSPHSDDAKSSLLHSVLHVLRPYFTVGSEVPPEDRDIVKALYGPMWSALNRCLHPNNTPDAEAESLTCTR